jgi:hypothetical protein
MAYCAICGIDHNPERPCSSLVGDKLHQIGLDGGAKKSKVEFRKLEKKADRYMLKFALIAIAILILSVAAFLIIGGNLKF